MGCIIRNKDGNPTGATAPNGKASVLFNSLKRATGSTDIAYDIYSEIRKKEWKKWFGLDWEKAKSIDNLFTDDNGERKLLRDKGYYTFMNTKGQIKIVPQAKIRERSNSTGLGFEEETAIKDTVITLINAVINQNPKYFKGKEAKGK